jgi:transposase
MTHNRGNTQSYFHHVIVYLYIQGETRRDMYERLGCCGSVIDRAMRGVPAEVKAIRAALIERRRVEKAKEIQDLRNHGASLTEISEALGYSTSWMKEHTTPPACSTIIAANKTFTDEEIAHVRAAYLVAGESCRTLAPRFGVSHETIAQMVKPVRDEKRSVEKARLAAERAVREASREPMRPQTRKGDVLLHAAVMTLHEAGFRIVEIAAVTGMTQGRVWRWTHGLGVKRFTQSAKGSTQ